MSRHRQVNKFQGLHFGDSFKEWIKGYRRRKASTKNAMLLGGEVWDMRYDLFPHRSIPVPDKPGYVTYDQSFFRVVTRGSKISQDLTYFFTDERYYPSEDQIGYDNAHSLGEFFDFVDHFLVVDGIAIYAIEWKEVGIKNKKYYLPVGLSWVNPATVNFVNKNEILAEQKFSWVAKHAEDYYQYQDHSFKKDELLVFRHPTLFPSSPVGKSLELSRHLNDWTEFSLLSGQASNEPLNHLLPVERSRYINLEELRRNEDVKRLKIRRLFKQPIGGMNAQITDYYAVLGYLEYKKQLNKMRDYLVGEFNKQLLDLVADKNKIKSPITLEYRGFISDTQLDLAFDKFRRGTINVQEFAERVKDDYNKDLF